MQAGIPDSGRIDRKNLPGKPEVVWYRTSVSRYFLVLDQSFASVDRISYWSMLNWEAVSVGKEVLFFILGHKSFVW